MNKSKKYQRYNEYDNLLEGGEEAPADDAAEGAEAKSQGAKSQGSKKSGSKKSS